MNNSKLTNTQSFLTVGLTEMNKFLFFLMVFSLISSTSAAQEFIKPFKINDPEIIDRYKYMYKEADAGGSFDPATGTVTFSAIDINVPGNFSIPVALERWVPASDLRSGGFGVSPWNWNIPLIKLNYVAKDPYRQANGEILPSDHGVSIGKNCSQGPTSPVVVSNREFSHAAEAYFYWSGKELHIPGKTTEKFLQANVQSPYLNGKQITKSNYYVSECINLANNEEGFVVKGPDGLTYTFGKIATYYTGVVPPAIHSPLTTFTKLALITRIQDEFGNTVDYKYDAPGELLSRIEASDGRYINIAYKPIQAGSGVKYTADYAETNGRRWRYEYHNGDLHKVYLPDNSYWQYDANIRKTGYVPVSNYRGSNYDSATGKNIAGACSLIAPTSSTSHQAPFTTTVVSPSGATTRYSFELVYKGRSKVMPVVELRVSPSSVDYNSIFLYQRARNMNCEVGFSLREKVITGVNLAEQKWNYYYSQNRGTYTVENPCSYLGWSGDCGNLNDHQRGDPRLTFLSSKPSVIQDVEDFRSVIVAGPDSRTVYYVDRKFKSATEGSVVAQDSLAVSSNALLKRVEYEYMRGGEVLGESWAKEISGSVDGFYVYAAMNNDLLRYRINKTKTKTTLFHTDGSSTYHIDESNHDVFGLPEVTYEYNDFSSYKRYTKQGYLHDQTQWVIGLPTVKRISADNITYTNTEEIVYHSATNTNLYAGLYLPYEYKSFSTWLRRYPEYHASGQLKRIEYNQQLRNSAGALVTGKNRYQILTNYKRGKAQTIQLSQRYSDSANMSFSRTVSDDGWVTSITDLNGVTAHYGYDLVGRLKSVDLPDAWLDTSIEWQEPVSGPIKRISRSCILNADKSGCESGSISFVSTSEYDALYRILGTGDWDLANNKYRYQNAAYNSQHQLTFNSFKSESVTETQGTTNTYDDLGRLTTVSLSNGGNIRHQYLSGNKIKVTDAEGNETTTAYLAYGSPDYSKALTINAPEGITTSHAINVFGDLTSTTQTGPGKNGSGTLSLTEYRAYDAMHYLCKVSRSDVGTTVFKNNLLGEVQWKAQGVGGGTVTDCNSDANDNNKIYLTSDNLGDLWKVNYPDNDVVSAPDIVQTRDQNGNIETIQVGSITQSYNYNILDLLEDETLQVDGKNLTLDYDYSPAGHLAHLTYPDGSKVSFSPNAFGEAQSVIRNTSGGEPFTYASDVNYYPNGYTNSFLYGNGLSHKTTLNSLQLPDSVKDYRAGFNALHYSYTYNNNLKVTLLTDHIDNNYSIRRFAYDGAGRLTSTTGNAGAGNSQMRYDGLDNITWHHNKKHTLDYNYDTSNRLQSVASSGVEAKPYGLITYDDRGNITHNSYHDFIYNRANQLVESGANRYKYDAYNRRVVTTDGSKTTYSFYSQSGKLFYTETAAGGINYVYLGNRLIAKDGVIPENGNRQHYLPFGASIEGEINDVGYTGHKFDKDIDLSYMQARYYDPVLGRFMSPDPIGSADQFNLFAYVGNDPVNYVDPAGTNRMRPPLPGEIRRDNKFAQVVGEKIADALPDGSAKNFVQRGVDGLKALNKAADSASARSPSNAVKLEKQLTSEAQNAEIKSGQGTVTHGNGTAKPLEQADRLASQNGGQPGDYQKVSSSATKASDGQHIETHAYRNVKTEQVIEPKTIINPQVPGKQ